MGERVIQTYRVPVMSGRSAVLEVEVVEDEPPKRWRLKLALLLIRWAGRLARVRVRVENQIS